MKSNPEQKESPVGRRGVAGNYSDNYEEKRRCQWPFFGFLNASDEDF